MYSMSIIIIIIIKAPTFSVNLSFATGTLPRQLKWDRVTPIFKKADHDLLVDYRSITVSNSLSKIFQILLIVNELASTLLPIKSVVSFVDQIPLIVFESTSTVLTN